MSNPADWLAGVRLVDLTVPLSPEHPCWWPGNIPLGVQRVGWYDNAAAPYFNRLLTLEEHTGTHMDAPAHFIPDPLLGFPRATPAGAVTAERVGLEQLIVPAAVLDATDLIDAGEPGISPRITRARLEAWEAQHGALRRGEGLLIYTGWTDRYYLPLPAGRRHADIPVLEGTVGAWPALEIDALEYVAERGAVLVGCDCPSVGTLDTIVECHYAGLGRGLVFIENLTALGQLPARGALFMFLPLKLVGGSGAPGRAAALVPA